jgi:ribose 5-phosphate isomerase A
LKVNGIEVFELNDVNEILFYIDGADEVDPSHNLIKGGGGAHTREKIVASASNEFICIVDHSKIVEVLGGFPLPIEVIVKSRSFVAREIVKLGGEPVLRNGFMTDQGNQILDVNGLKINDPLMLEEKINLIPGVLDNGIFANCRPHKLIVGKV